MKNGKGINPFQLLKIINKIIERGKW